MAVNPHDLSVADVLGHISITNEETEYTDEEARLNFSALTSRGDDSLEITVSGYTAKDEDTPVNPVTYVFRLVAVEKD